MSIFFDILAMSSYSANAGRAPSGMPWPQLPLNPPRLGEELPKDGSSKLDFNEQRRAAHSARYDLTAVPPQTSDPTPTFSTKPNFGVTHQPYGMGEKLGEEVDLRPLSVSMIGEGYSRWAYRPQS